MLLLEEIPDPPKKSYLIQMIDERIVVINSASDPTGHPSFHNKIKAVIIIDCIEE